MRSMLVRVLAMLMTTMINTNAAENTHSANYMLPYCKLTAGQVVDNPSDSYLVGRCAGLIEGVVNMSGLLKAMQAVGDIPHLDPLLCAALPEQVTIEQVLMVVVGYGETHPREGPLPFTVLVLDALHDAWPCKN
jgi:Rap1a immunity proteins